MKTYSEIFEAVKEAVQETVHTVENADDLSPQSALADLGIDSISVLPMLLQLVTKLGCDLDKITENLETPRTIGDLVTILSSAENLHRDHEQL
jgi:acyl carrier protein